MREVDENCGIYCIENLVNGKKYIGQSKNIKERWYNHRLDLKGNKHHNSYLQNSYKKYGRFNFNFYILENCSVCDLAKKEIEYMKKYNTTNRKFGYNLRASLQEGVEFNKEYLKTMREVQKSKPIYQIDLKGNIINKWDGGCRHAAKELNFAQGTMWQCCNKNLYTYKNFIWIYCEEYDVNNFCLDFYIKNKLKKAIVQLDKELKYIRTWETAKEASISLDLDSSLITKNCRHKTAYCGDYIFEYEVNYLNNNLNPRKPKIGKNVVQLTKSGEYIKTWNSLYHVAKEFKKDNTGFRKCCEGEYKVSHGYKWMYLEDYEKLRKEILN